MIWDWVYVLLVGLRDSVLVDLPVYESMNLCFGCTEWASLLGLSVALFSSFIDVGVVFGLLAFALSVRAFRMLFDTVNLMINMIPVLRKWI